MAKQPGGTAHSPRAKSGTADKKRRKSTSASPATHELARKVVKARLERSTVQVPEYTTSATKHVWLTFDDGPHPTCTEKALSILDKHKIKATFFVVGSNASRYGSILSRAFKAGHQIANHSFSHRDLTRLTENEIKKEIEDTHNLIRNYLGGDWMFRPPYGAHNALVDGVSRDLGYRTVLWSVDTLDWDRRYQPDRWAQHGVDQIRARDTSTVLMHDIHATTVDNLDMFITRIKALGNVVFEGSSPALTV
ncbi:polysaccharide deacetylase family protein [Rhizobium leguminosarum]|uniref:polysaccharide deacetylase family protein n=1 Tax=Rhizobium leguminosarum TaxID=384 RepID=UPI003F98372B